MGLLSWCAAVAMALSISATSEAAGGAREDGMDRLLDAIAQVESGGDPDARGDHGRAIGAYQIHRSYWREGTEFLGVDWSYRDARDPDKARQVVRAYLSHYGRGKTLLEMARIHNGGPNGWEKAATRAYADRVREILGRQP